MSHQNKIVFLLLSLRVRFPNTSRVKNVVQCPSVHSVQVNLGKKNAATLWWQPNHGCCGEQVGMSWPTRPPSQPLFTIPVECV